MYIIEGRAPSPDWSDQKVGGILVGNMIAKLDHFAMRDNVWVDYTRDARHTAARLIELGKHITTLKSVVQAKEEIKGDQFGISFVDGGAPIDVDAIVKKKHERSVAEVRRRMLMCVAGIGEKIATSLLDDYKWSDIITQQNCTIKSTKATAELRELLAGNRQTTYVAMLATIKGVSEKIATTIAAMIPLSRLIIRDITMANVIANIKLGETNRRLGDKLADIIVSHWSDPAQILNPVTEISLLDVQSVASNDSRGDGVPQQPVAS
jgi:ERCC4-type nuclease